MLREQVPHLGGGPVAVVRQRLHEHGDALRAVALVHDRLEAGPSASAPLPFAIARSMLSFGIEYERACSIAF